MDEIFVKQNEEQIEDISERSGDEDRPVHRRHVKQHLGGEEFDSRDRPLTR